LIDVGFRTYVRYEVGERHAPVNVVIKMAKLENISLDQLLSTALRAARRYYQNHPQTHTYNLKI